MKSSWRGSIQAVSITVTLSAISALPGCIIVSERDSDYERIEEKKADAQYMTARVELEKINLERQKAGLAPIDIPPHPSSDPDCDSPSGNPE
jgi:hypothetical protein